MKKIGLITISTLLIIGLVVFGINTKKDSNLEKVRVAEVTHSVFYAPFYIAVEEGYFEDEGIDLEIILAPGADKVTASVLSGDVEIGLCGSEATIYLYNQGLNDYLVNFSALTKRDGSFILGRNKNEVFDFKKLKGKTIIGGRKGGMPAMTLEWLLKEAGLKPGVDVFIDTSIAFTAMNGAFIGGQGDYVTLFNPSALKMEQEGYGYVIASLGELGNTVPYTTFNAKKSYIKDNEDVIKGFTKAIQKGLDFVHNNSKEVVAKSIYNQFPDTSMNDLVAIVESYQEIDSWYGTTEISEKDFDHVQDIIKNANELDKKAPFKALVDNGFVSK